MHNCYGLFIVQKYPVSIQFSHIYSIVRHLPLVQLCIAVAIVTSESPEELDISEKQITHNSNV